MAADFLLGLTGAILSIISLTWQVFSWCASGARLKVSCVSSYPLGSGMPEIELLGIQVANSGRSSTVINNVAFKHPDSKVLQILDDEAGVISLPYEIRSGALRSFSTEGVDAEARVLARNVHRSKGIVRPWLLYRKSHST